VLAIVPADSPQSAKRRLASLYPAQLRAGLIEAMLADVVAACKEARSVEDILVVTPDARLVPAGIDVLVDAGKGHANAVSEALARCTGDGALVVMADCPLVRPETLDLLCDSARPAALAPAQDGGTNALALRPHDVLEPAFGLRGGAAIVSERAERHGVPLAVIDDPFLALDVDRPEDVERVLEMGAGTHTREFLDQALALSAEFPYGR
jgi:2-phospho-L-lactate/phosphoenolpyruvate guanylyltransferase